MTGGCCFATKSAWEINNQSGIKNCEKDNVQFTFSCTNGATDILALAFDIQMSEDQNFLDCFLTSPYCTNT